MIRNLMVLGAVVTGVALAVPAIDQARPGLFPDLAQRILGSDRIEEIPALAMFEADPEKVTTGRRVRIRADGNGHFHGDFRINGRTEKAMIDTGASVVALNVSAARRAGVTVASADFRQPVNTANGTIQAAPVTLARMEIGGISVRDVQAVVLEDRALSGTLIGMSFLRNLRRYQVEDGELLLEQ